MKAFKVKESSNKQDSFMVKCSVMHFGKDDFWPLLSSLDKEDLGNGFIVAAIFDRKDTGAHCMAVRGFDRANDQLICLNSYGPKGIKERGFYPLEPLYKWQVTFAAHIQVEEVKNADIENDNPKHFEKQAKDFTLYRRKVNAANYLPHFDFDDDVIESMKRINYGGRAFYSGELNEDHLPDGYSQEITDDKNIKGEAADNRESFEGYWKNGVKHGHGRHINFKGDIQEGIWSYGSFVEGVIFGCEFNEAFLPIYSERC